MRASSGWDCKGVCLFLFGCVYVRVCVCVSGRLLVYVCLCVYSLCVSVSVCAQDAALSRSFSLAKCAAVLCQWLQNKLHSVWGTNLRPCADSHPTPCCAAAVLAGLAGLAGLCTAVSLLHQSFNAAYCIQSSSPTIMLCVCPALRRCSGLLQEITLLAEQAVLHEASFGAVKWDKLSQEHFGGRRPAHRLRGAYEMYKRAQVGVLISAVCWYLCSSLACRACLAVCSWRFYTDESAYSSYHLQYPPCTPL